MYYLGIDTSNYTTSVAIVDDQENVVYDGRKLLEVKQGNRGLRQSEALFQHMQNLEPLCKEALNTAAPHKIGCITASNMPRNIEGSYMPVFMAGNNMASVMSSCLKVPFYQCSHQQGHTIAGAWSSGMELQGSFLTYHISGGTTELLKVNDLENVYEIVGGSEDLNAGQFIDRVGVAMGLKFPCGSEMDKLCGRYDVQAVNLPVSVRKSYLSFSGPESYVQRTLNKELLDSEAYQASIAKSVFLCIGKALEKTALHACIEHNIKRILFVGGVASNTVIKDILLNSAILWKNQVEVMISDPRFSSDNAVGSAIYGKRILKSNGGLYERD